MTNRLVSTEFTRRQQLCLDAVCRVVRQDKEHGTGFVIARQLIITNNHVLPDEQTCLDSEAEFFNEKGMKLVAVKLDPKTLFITSKSPGNVNSPTKKMLDFTIVALKPTDDDNLKRVYLNPLSIFREVVVPIASGEAFIIQHPKEGEDSTKKIPEGETKVLAVDEVAVHYNTATRGGSSGGPVLDSERRLYALHRLGGCLTHGAACNQGVLIQAIVTFLKEEKDQTGKFYFSFLEAWMTKEAPTNKAASLFFFMARKEVEKAREYLKHAHRQHEAVERREVVGQFTRALQSCEKAMQVYNRQPSLDTLMQTEAAYVQKEMTLLKWQRMQLLLDLYLPLCLPNREDQNDPLIRFLLAEEPLDALDEILHVQEEILKETSELQDNPANCFFFAIVYEALKDNLPLSAQWYLLLGQTYLKRKANIFWIRSCLERAKKLHPSILMNQEYKSMDERVKAKEEKVEREYQACLDEIKKKAQLEKAPTCFILHDRTEETKKCVRSQLRPALQRIGAQPIDETDNTRNLPEFAFNAQYVQQSDFILQICTPKIVKAGLDSFSQVFFDLSLLMKQYPGIVSDKVFALLVQGNYAESIPFFFTSGDGNKVNAVTLENFYINSLETFAKIVRVDKGNFVGEIQDRFKARKRAIEQDVIIEPAPIIPTPIPKLLSMPSTFHISGISIPPLNSPIVREKVVLKELFDNFNFIILTQPAGVLFKTGKTTVARSYIDTKRYEYILWFDARNEESLKESLCTIKEDLKIENLFEFLSNQVTWLLVFDGAENETLLQSYIPENIPSKFSEYPQGMRRQVLITARNRSWSRGHPIDVEPFNEAECTICIEKIIKRSLETSQRREFAVRLGGVPSKIEEFAKWINGSSISFASIKKSWEGRLHSFRGGLVSKSNVSIFNDKFIGRSDILVTIEERFAEKRETPLIVSLHGPAGHGKTHIAAHYALINVVKYTAICWIDCSNPQTIFLSYNQLLQKFKLLGSSNPQKAVKDYLKSQKSWLIIFDNITSYDQIKDWLPSTYGHVLTISSHPIQDLKIQVSLEVPQPSSQEETVFVMNSLQDANEKEAKVLVEFLQNRLILLGLAVGYIAQTRSKILKYIDDLKRTLPENCSIEQISQAVVKLTWDKLKSDSEILSFCKFCVGCGFIPLQKEKLVQWAKQPEKDETKKSEKDEINVNAWLPILKEWGILDFDSEIVFIHPDIRALINSNISYSDKGRIEESIKKMYS